MGNEKLSQEVDNATHSGGDSDSSMGAYEVIFQEIEDAAFLIAVERAGGDYRFTYQRTNSSHQQLTGFSGAEIRGQTPRELLGEEEGSTIAANYRHCVQQEETIKYRESLDLPSGTRHWETKLTPITEEGEVTHIVGIGRDITERKRREQELEETKEYLDEIFENMPFGVYVLDAEDYTVDHANSRAVINEGQTCYEMTHGREQPCDQGDGTTWDCPLAAVVESGEPASVEHTHYDEDGEEGIYQVYASPILDEDGAVEHVVESNVEITERKQYEQQLEEQRDNLEILNQVMRHDIRNDLQIVTAYAELLAEKCTDAEIQDHIETVITNANHAVDLTVTARELADVMLSIDEQFDRRSVRTSLRGEIDEIRSSHPHATVTCETDIPDCAVRANEMLDSVFRNILKNAIQHNDKNTPTVDISATEQSEAVLVRIADNGPGVPDTEKEDIFGKGEKGLESQGTGLGLYLVRTLVEGYGGDVWVEDNDPTGAEFVVKLPKAA